MQYIPVGTLVPALSRAARTFLQAFVATLVLLLTPIALAFLNAVQEGSVYDLDLSVLARIGTAALLSGAVALFSFIQNTLEDIGAVKPLLKSYVKTTKNEVVDTSTPVPDPQPLDLVPLG